MVPAVDKIRYRCHTSERRFLFDCEGRGLLKIGGGSFAVLLSNADDDDKGDNVDFTLLPKSDDEDAFSEQLPVSFSF
jgi:hypothetical protein